MTILIKGFWFSLLALIVVSIFCLGTAGIPVMPQQISKSL